MLVDPTSLDRRHAHEQNDLSVIHTALINVFALDFDIRLNDYYHKFILMCIIHTVFSYDGGSPDSNNTNVHIDHCNTVFTI